ncbi:MAG TPA: isoprenylcysteine carboxylmethyltransferase family protein [Thermoanaerobaculia bacterium]|jgi:protein-S-isoprenylcysteine O-methyltransferase Ste14
MYVGIINAVLAGRGASWFPGQRAIGTFAITGGAALLVWAIGSFPSWRFRAKLDRGHELAMGGAFEILRHPMYTGVNLIGLGSAIWTPTAVTWIGFFLIVVGSELRARTEESVLSCAFGSRYTEYCERTKRFVPGVY